mmetsp:Transcript_29728/g.95877  ORF Transcript_29728/g.95877 Transcript_29728/m.95877 type:complete len:296 (+) Transcript_29728:305-1192(+)
MNELAPRLGARFLGGASCLEHEVFVVHLVDGEPDLFEVGAAEPGVCAGDLGPGFHDFFVAEVVGEFPAEGGDGRKVFEGPEVDVPRGGVGAVLRRGEHGVDELWISRGLLDAVSSGRDVDDGGGHGGGFLGLLVHGIEFVGAHGLHLLLGHLARRGHLLGGHGLHLFFHHVQGRRIRLEQVQRHLQYVGVRPHLLHLVLLVRRQVLHLRQHHLDLALVQILHRVRRHLHLLRRQRTQRTLRRRVDPPRRLWGRRRHQRREPHHAARHRRHGKQRQAPAQCKHRGISDGGLDVVEH